MNKYQKRKEKVRQEAIELFYRLDDEEIDQLECIIEELYPDGINETTLNDLLWFDDETVADWLGVNLEEIYAREV